MPCGLATRLWRRRRPRVLRFARQNEIEPPAHSELANDSRVGDDNLIEPESSGRESDCDSICDGGDVEHYEVIARTGIVRFVGQVLPVSGEHFQELHRFVFGEVQDSKSTDGRDQLVPAPDESLVVDCSPTVSGASKKS